MDRAELSQRITDGIRAGRLPRTREAAIWSRSGGGQPCDGCREPITIGEPELQFDFLTANGVTMCRLHPLCFSVWALERPTAARS
jgi:hypothetical protein